MFIIPIQVLIGIILAGVGLLLLIIVNIINRVNKEIKKIRRSKENENQPRN